MDPAVSHTVRLGRPTDRTYCGLHTLSVAASRRHHCNGCQSLKFTRDRNGGIYTGRREAGGHDVALIADPRTASKDKDENDPALRGLRLNRHVAPPIAVLSPPGPADSEA